MPPRLQALPRLGTVNLCIRSAAKPITPSFLPLTQTANLSLREKKRKAKQDPYRWAQAQQRKAANVERRNELERERDAAQGDPILGRAKPTPFLESLESKTQAPAITKGQDPEQTVSLRNHFLTDEELASAIAHAHTLTKPMVGVFEAQLEPGSQEDRNAEHEQRHKKAAEALRRITALSNGSAKDRSRANVRLVVSEFGRHETDKVLKPRAKSIRPNTEEMPERAGPDTGSSEVQIAILTIKIRNLHQALQMNRGYKDKHNKRNLRLLLHRRQKLLKYMERKERGSERWTHMMEKLGLTPATYKGQIEL